jgi:hypothetical protein
MISYIRTFSDILDKRVQFIVCECYAYQIISVNFCSIICLKCVALLSVIQL